MHDANDMARRRKCLEREITTKEPAGARYEQHSVTRALAYLIDYLLQFRNGQPACIRLAAVAEALGTGPAAIVVADFILAPVPNGWKDRVEVVVLQSVLRIVLADHHLMELLSGPPSHDLHVALRSNHARKVDELHAGNLRNKNLAATHLPETLKNELHAAVERDPEARHSRIRDWQLSSFCPLLKQRYDTAPASHHVSIAHHAETRTVDSDVAVGRHKELVGAQLGCAVEADRTRRLIGAERYDFFHATIDRGVDHVSGTEDVGLDRFQWIVFRSGDLLQCRSMHDNVHPVESPVESIAVAHVPDEEADVRVLVIREMRMHLRLLQLISAENDQALRIELG